MADLCNSNTSHRERDGNYHSVIFSKGDWRVIVCKDDLQWIIQRRTRAGSPDRARWQAYSYPTERDALVRLWSEVTGDDGAYLRSILPELFRSRR